MEGEVGGGARRQEGATHSLTQRCQLKADGKLLPEKTAEGRVGVGDESH